jgi:hypothetical protein
VSFATPYAAAACPRLQQWRDVRQGMHDAVEQLAICVPIRRR